LSGVVKGSWKSLGGLHERFVSSYAIIDLPAQWKCLPPSVGSGSSSWLHRLPLAVDALVGILRRNIRFATGAPKLSCPPIVVIHSAKLRRCQALISTTFSSVIEYHAGCRLIDNIFSQFFRCLRWRVDVSMWGMRSCIDFDRIPPSREDWSGGCVAGVRYI
jgi:hypothetical protein